MSNFCQLQKNCGLWYLYLESLPYKRHLMRAVLGCQIFLSPLLALLPAGLGQPHRLLRTALLLLLPRAGGVPFHWPHWLSGGNTPYSNIVYVLGSEGNIDVSPVCWLGRAGCDFHLYQRIFLKHESY